MPLVVVITRDVEDRYRGYLGSMMLELAPGVYAQPRMSARVRQRLGDEGPCALCAGRADATWPDAEIALVAHSRGSAHRAKPMFSLTKARARRLRRSGAPRESAV